MKINCVLFSLLLLHTGCNVGTVYAPPLIEAPEMWKTPQTQEEGVCYPDFWWEVFDDPSLSALEQEAVDKNDTLKIAFSRVQEARALAKAAQSELYPQLSLNPSYNNEGVLYESYSNGVIVRAHELLYLLPLNLSYEADLWGKIRSQVEAAYDTWEGQAEAYVATMLILTADVATTYYQLRTLDAQIALLQATVENRQKTLALNRSRYAARVSDYFDVTRAALDVALAQAEYRDRLRLRAELENRLAVLIGTPASDFHLSPLPLEGSPPPIPVTLPSEVLMRRPDIAEAERLMAAQHALVNAAYASFFPSLSLTAAAGYSSPHLRFFLHSFSRLWEYGVSAAQMIFDGGLLAAQLAEQQALFREASSAYQLRVLTCFQEVEDTLSNLKLYGEEFEDASNAVDWARQTYRIALNRYLSGVKSYLDVVVSERDELSNQLLQVELNGLRFVNTIQLIKVIGGGW